jgi:hypothetical protein
MEFVNRKLRLFNPLQFTFYGKPHEKLNPLTPFPMREGENSKSLSF